MKRTMLTDVHTHSAFSCDGVSPLTEMLATACAQSVAFYGVAEHVDYGENLSEDLPLIDEEEYFHAARHLQEDYAGVMNVLVGVEFGYDKDVSVQGRYAITVQKRQPDFVVNSIHLRDKVDYYHQTPYYKTDENGKQILRDKKQVYEEYLQLVLQSLDVPYHYDIVGHLGYPVRYAPYQDKAMRYQDFPKAFDRVLQTIIQKNKILEVNASANGSGELCFACPDVLKRYFELGGRQVSYASDAHSKQSILRNREQVVQMLKEIGFTYLTVPCRGEYIKVEI